MVTQRQPTESVGSFAEKRYADRKAVSLNLRGWVDGTERTLIVHDLSHTGFLVESSPALTLDQKIELELPHEGRKEAKVVWAGDKLAGCTFDGTISKASLSAALLKSEVLVPQAPVEAESGTAEQIAYYAEEESSVVPLPMPARMLVILGASVLVWLPLLFGASLLLG